MGSFAYLMWTFNRSSALDEIERALVALGNAGAGVKFGREQLAQAYVVLLSGHFQAFCRDLHSEAIDFVVDQVQPPYLRSLMRLDMTKHRKLDQGNPNEGHLGADFNRLGMTFIPSVKQSHAKNSDRLADLAELLKMRNEIAHQSFKPMLGQSQLKLTEVRRWRKSCNELAITFDSVVHNYLATLIGHQPWTPV